MLVTGVDGSDRITGWIAVTLLDGHLHTAQQQPTLRSVLEANPESKVVAVDIPIGHEAAPGDGRRRCDVEAREFVGAARARSVFWVPPPAVLRAPDIETSLAVADRSGWMRPSPLIWGLRRRIFEAHEIAKDERVIEIHPEVSFTALMRETKRGDTLQHPKTTWDGLVERLELLHAEKLRPTRSFGGLGRASPDDVLDATIAAWSAARHADGRSRSLPDGPPRDPETRRRVAVWY